MAIYGVTFGGKTTVGKFEHTKANLPRVLQLHDLPSFNSYYFRFTLHFSERVTFYRQRLIITSCTLQAHNIRQSKSFCYIFVPNYNPRQTDGRSYGLA